MRYIFLILMLMPVTSQAINVPVDYKEMRRMTKQLRTLHKAGKAIHQSQGKKSLPELKACVAKNGHLRDEAKKLWYQAKEVGAIDYRVPLVMAADAAFTCVYCSGTGSSCSEILPEVVTVEKLLREAGH